MLVRGARWLAAIVLLASIALLVAGPSAAQSGSAATATIGGRVHDTAGAPVAGVVVDLFTEDRAAYVQSVSSGADGRFAFASVAPACYVATFVAPPSAPFEGGRDHLNVEVCVIDGQVVDDLNATVIDPATAAGLVAEVAERTSGQEVDNVIVDLFSADRDGNRIDFLRSGRTSADGGGFTFDGLAPGCYTVTFVAPDGTFFNGAAGPSPWTNLSACPGAGELVTRTALLDGAAGTADLRVIVADETKDPVDGVVVDLFAAGGDGTRSTYLGSGATTGADLVFGVSPGCHVVVAIAPDGRRFATGSPWSETAVCLDVDGEETVIVELAPADSPEPVWERGFDDEAVGTHPWDELVTVRDGCGPDGSRCIEVRYEPYDRGSHRVTGRTPLPPADEYTLNYDVRFEDGFQFVRGGKLHGLGPDEPITGCKPMTSDGWSARVMWRAEGSAESYVYHQDKDSGCGDSSRVDTPFIPGRWMAVSLHVQLNSSADTPDGFVRLYLDGELVVESADIRLRAADGDEGLISQFLLSTFHGGSDPSWAPDSPQFAHFDNFVVHPGERVRASPGQ